MVRTAHRGAIIKNMHQKLLFLILAIGMITSQSCKNDQGQTAIETPRKKLAIPPFNGDSAYVHIEKQLSFGYRIPGTEPHRKTIEWIVAKMEGYGAEVITQNFSASFLGEKDVACTNIMAQINPEKNKRVLLAAHFDSRKIADKDDERVDEPIAGADDGGSGTALLIEIARTLNENPIDIGVDFLFFDAEDQGEMSVGADLTWALGSQYWSQNKVPKGYQAKYGILLDMVGAKDATFGKEGNSTRFAQDIVDKTWSLARSMGYSDFFQDFNTGAVNDDHLYVNFYAKIPMINIIHQNARDRSSFGDYHHTHDDNIDIISNRTLRVVGQVVTAVLYNESNGTF